MQNDLPGDLPEDHLDQPSEALIATKMAPNLLSSTREFIHGMLMSNDLTTSKIVDAAKCDPSTVSRHRTNLHLFGTTSAPPNEKGRPRILTIVCKNGARFTLLQLIDMVHPNLDKTKSQINIVTCHSNLPYSDLQNQFPS